MHNELGSYERAASEYRSRVDIYSDRPVHAGVAIGYGLIVIAQAIVHAAIIMKGK